MSVETFCASENIAMTILKECIVKECIVKGLLNIEGDVFNTFGKRKDWDHGTSKSGDCEDRIRSLLDSLMKVVQTTAACECVHVCSMVIKALIWMQSLEESFDVSLILNARFKANPEMASQRLHELDLMRIQDQPTLS